MDSDPIMTSKAAPDNISGIITDIASHIQYKFLGLMLFVFCFLSSDVFINRILATWPGAVNIKCPTTWGTILQGIFLVICMMGIDAFIRQKII